MARVCREAGARVQTNKFLRDLNVDGISLIGRLVHILSQRSGIGNGLYEVSESVKHHIRDHQACRA